MGFQCGIVDNQATQAAGSVARGVPGAKAREWLAGGRAGASVGAE